MTDTTRIDPTQRAPLKIDSEAWYTPEQLAGLLPWSTATFAA